jgi:hypothetical protein
VENYKEQKESTFTFIQCVSYEGKGKERKELGRRGNCWERRGRKGKVRKE